MEKKEPLEVEVKIKMKIYEDAFFLRQSHASGKIEETGEEFEFSTNVAGGHPIVQFKSKDGKHWTCYTFSIDAIMQAVANYRHKDDEVKS
jgi:hypothetical protein